MTQQEPGNDYPLSEVPMHARKGLASTAMVLLGFTFFTATMFAGGKLGVAFSFIDMLGETFKEVLEEEVKVSSPFGMLRSLLTKNRSANPVTRTPPTTTVS